MCAYCKLAINRTSRCYLHISPQISPNRSINRRMKFPTDLWFKACRGWIGGKDVGTMLLFGVPFRSLADGWKSASKIAIMESKWRQVRWSLQLSHPLTTTVSAIEKQGYQIGLNGYWPHNEIAALDLVSFYNTTRFYWSYPSFCPVFE